MKTVLCYGDSNTWGSATIDRPAGRYGPDERWPGVFAAELGRGWRVVEEGLPGRTTVHDDPIEGAHLNGRAYLTPCLLSHRPLDLVIIMLGTNDLKARFGLPAPEIANCVGVLIDDVRLARKGVGADEGVGPDGRVPEVLIVAPPPLAARNAELEDMFVDADARGAGLADAYAAVAAGRGAHVFDAGTVITSCDYDGIHLDLDMHERLGRALAERVAVLAEQVVS